MTGKKWTEEETILLWSDMTNEEISEKTGRTMDAVRTKRFNLTGHYTPSDARKGRKAVYVSPVHSEYEDQRTKTNRIIVMASKMGVRIKGVR